MLQDGYDLARPDEKQSFDFDNDLLLTILALLLPANQLDGYEEAPNKVPSSMQQSICTVLKTLIGHRNESYATTIAEDTMLLQQDSLPPRKLMAIQVRLGEKEILAMAANEVDMRLANLMTAQGSPETNETKKRRT